MPGRGPVIVCCSARSVVIRRQTPVQVEGYCRVCRTEYSLRIAKPAPAKLALAA